MITWFFFSLAKPHANRHATVSFFSLRHRYYASNPSKIWAIFLRIVLTCHSGMHIEFLVASVTCWESVLLLPGPNKMPPETKSHQRAEQNTPSRLITAQTPAVSQSLKSSEISPAQQCSVYTDSSHHKVPSGLHSSETRGSVNPTRRSTVTWENVGNDSISIIICPSFSNGSLL